MLVKRSNWQNAMFFLSASQRVLRQRGFTEIFILHPQDSVEDERQQLEMCIDRRVEGIILLPVTERGRGNNVELINEIHRDEEIPIVQLGMALDGCAAPSVISDDIAGVRQAVQRLHEMGHRHLAHVTIKGHDDHDPSNPFRASRFRAEGYAQGMRELGLATQYFAAEPSTGAAGMTLLYDMAVALCPQIAAASPRPTAITCYADFMAAGIESGLSDLGVKVPQDISIIGYGDQPFGKMLRPQISTLAPLYERMGEFATQQLLSMIEVGEGQSLALPPKLVMRQSVRDLRAS
jgi:LacI family transcriptional regulator